LGRFTQSKTVIEEGLNYARGYRETGYEVEMLAQAAQLAESQNRVADAIDLYRKAAARATSMEFNRGIAETSTAC
jgi:hypothetical protein